MNKCKEKRVAEIKGMKQRVSSAMQNAVLGKKKTDWPISITIPVLNSHMHIG